MDKAVLSLELKLVRASDSVTPLTLEKSAPANNGTLRQSFFYFFKLVLIFLVLNALFGRSALYLNNVPVNQSTHHHSLKAYLHQLISTSRMEKMAPCEVKFLISPLKNKSDPYEIKCVSFRLRAIGILMECTKIVPLIQDLS